MKIILIYGPPASGKLTVANKLAEKLSFVVLHNHKTIDLYKEVMEFGTKEFWERVSSLRFELMELAARNRRDFVMTFCYEPGDEHYIKRIEKIAKKNKSEVYYVGLRCSKEELRRRVLGESRKAYGKIKSVEDIDRALVEHDYSKKINGKNTLEIDNTEITPEQVAEDIVRSFKL